MHFVVPGIVDGSDSWQPFLTGESRLKKKILRHVASAIWMVAATTAVAGPIQHYTTEDGLAGAVVRSIERTPDGRVWFGCWGRGISAFDGLNWTTYDQESQLPSLDVRVIRRDGQGRLWAGMAGALAYFVGDQWVAVETGLEEVGAPQVFTVVPFPDGRVWFGLGGGQVIEFEPDPSENGTGIPRGSWTLRLDQDESQMTGAVQAILPLPDGGVVVGSDTRGILRWRDGAWYQAPGDEQVRGADAILALRNGTLYAGGGMGLWKRASADPGWTQVGEEPVRELALLSDGRLAVAYQYRAAYWAEEGTHPIKLAPGDTPIPLQTVVHFADRNETWVGSKLGCYRIGRFGWEPFPQTTDGVELPGTCLFADGEVPATTVDKRGRLVQFVDRRWEVVGQLPPHGYTHISRGRDNTLLLVGAKTGIRWDIAQRAQVESWSLPNDAHSLLETRGGRLFAIGIDDISEWVGSEWRLTPLGTQSPEEDLAAVMETEDGKLLISTLTALTQWDLTDNHGMEIRHRISTDQNFRGFIGEPDGSVLVGSNEEGIFRFQDGQLHFEIPFEKDPSARVRCMLRARNGRIWTGALDMGIASFQDGRWNWFGVEDGVPTGGSRVFVEDPEGALWTAIEGGEILRYEASPYPPETRIRQVPKQIPYKERSVFQFDGAAPWAITDHEDLVYAWRIRPQGGKQAAPWTVYTRERSVISPRLDAGAYIFEVRAADRDFNSDPTPAAASFVVAAPLWATPAFLIPITTLVFVVLFIAGLLGRNYTALHSSERALREAKDVAEAASRAKSQFLAHISHEIRTPMNAILGHVQVLQTTPRSEEDKNNLAIIARSGDHLLELINNMLEMAKIEAGRVMLSESTFPIREMLEQLFDMLGVQCDPNRVTLSKSVDEDVPEFVVADQGKLRQVLINLIGNALKFTQTGRIVLHTGVTDLPTEPGKIQLNFTLTDTGPGIGTDELDRIFDAFELAAAGKNFGGAGLGLPICRRHLDAMGGSIRVDSQLGEGTTVRVVLPVGIGESGDAPPPLKTRARTTSTTKRGRVLVVDDIDTNRDVLEKILKHIGFEVKGVSNGKDAIAVFEDWKPDVTLMDRAMPEMDGIETTQRIRALAGGEDAPIIFVTGAALDEDRREMMAAGATEVVHKPFRQEELLAKIEKSLASRTHESGIDN